MQKRVIATIVGIPVGLLIASAGYYVRVKWEYDYKPAAAELPAAERDYRAAGLPWTARDLRPTPDPEARRAGALIRAAGKEMDRGGWSRADRDLRASLDADDLAPVEMRLARYAPVLARFERAAEIGRLDFARDLDLGANLLLPEYSRIRVGVRTLGYRARVHAARGDLAGARRDLDSMRTLARMTESDGLIFAMLTRIACDAIADDAAQRAVAASPRLAAGALADLERPVSGSGAAPDFRRMLRYEAYFGLATARNVKGRLTPADVRDAHAENAPEPGTRPESGYRIEKDPARLRRDGLPTGTAERAYAARWLEVWTRIAGEMRRTGDDPVRLAEEIDRITEENEAIRRKSYDLNRVLMPVFGLAGAAVAKSRASREITRAYLRAIATRERTGAFPDKLIAGNDPFGRPYVVRREGKGFRIYSLGANGVDEGGLTSTERTARGRLAEGGKNDDVAALYPPAVPRGSSSSRDAAW